jgi:excisionase family DNA binding protein
MKNLSENKKTGNTSPKPRKAIDPSKSRSKPVSVIPAASKLNEVYMDVQQVAFELNISKRTIRNMRKSGKLSYTRLHGKLFYFRRELAEILEANKVPQKDNIDNLSMKSIAAASDGAYHFSLTRMTGNTNSEFMGMPANTPIDVTNVDVVRIKNGKAVEHWDYISPKEAMDMMNMHHQMPMDSTKTQ